MFKKAIFLTVYIMANHLLTAQSPDLETDRPDQTETPFTVPAKHFQAELGFNFTKEDGNYTISNPTALWKYGLFQNTELRLITEITTSSANLKQFQFGFLPLQIGFKTAICQEQKARPKISFIAHLALPYVSTKNERIPYVAPNFRFTMQHTLTSKMSLGYNIGAQWNGTSPAPEFVYTVAHGIDLHPKVYFYYEFFGAVPVNLKTTHATDIGFAVLAKQNLQFDLSGGFQFYPFAEFWYVAAGISFRLPH